MVLPTVLDKETEVKRKVSYMPHAPVGAKRGIKNKKKSSAVTDQHQERISEQDS
jgi:hypothetical protein